MSNTRTRTSASSKTIISGTNRYKYFKRPIMPRVNPVPPQILLAPTTTENPLESDIKNDNNNSIEPTIKEVGVQTQYRESEAQTTPYTPDYILANDNASNELLLLKNFNYNNGLPLGKKEIDMIEYSRNKRNLELNLPPFTDECSLILRKKLMEQQELIEFKLRETEIDNKRNEKLEELKQALIDREESKEFLTSQRLDSIKLLRLEDKEKILAKIRNKRIKALRRLANQRNQCDPVLSEGKSRDIINDYFNKNSTVYAPKKHEGSENTVKPSENFDIAPRTMPLDNINNIINLETSLPRRLLDNNSDSNVDNLLMAKTMPSRNKPKFSGGGKVAEERLTSAAQRQLRMTKRDVEEMHQILLRKKLDAMGVPRPDSKRGMTASSQITIEDVMGSSQDGRHSAPGTATGKSTILSQLMAKKPKGRPPTPDFTVDRIIRPPEQNAPDNEDEEAADDTAGKPVATNVVEEDNINYELKNDHEFQAAVTLLQRLIRGRSVQNIMYEGKYRRAELIHELQIADEEMAEEEALKAADPDNHGKENQEKFFKRKEDLQSSSIDAVAGSYTSNMLHNYSIEMDRGNMISGLEAIAAVAIKERLTREVTESGRRQKEGKIYPQPQNESN